MSERQDFTPFKPKLASILFRLPLFLSFDLLSLRNILEILPSGYRYTVEFRHASWLTDDTFNPLKSCNAYHVSAISEREITFEMTADFGCIRFMVRRDDMEETTTM